MHGRPNRNRRIDPQEVKEKAEQAAAKKAKTAKDAGTNSFKAPRKGGKITCKHCKETGHNVRTCPRKLLSSLDATAAAPAPIDPPVQPPVQPSTEPPVEPPVQPPVQPPPPVGTHQYATRRNVSR